MHRFTFLLLLTACTTDHDNTLETPAASASCAEAQTLQLSHTLKWGAIGMHYVPPPLPAEVYEACDSSSDD